MDKNLRVEWKTVTFVYGSIYRYVYWRVIPCYLKWWQRLFNPWRKMYHFDYRGKSDDVFSPAEFCATKEECQTVGDIERVFDDARKRRDKIWDV